MRAVLRSQCAVQPRFTELHAVQQHPRKREAVDGVGENAAALRHRVVADHEYKHGSVFQSCHHAERARFAEYDLRAGIEKIRQQVAEPSVRIVDPDVGCAARECPLYRCVCLKRHPAASAFIFDVARTRLLGRGAMPAGRVRSAN